MDAIKVKFWGVRGSYPQCRSTYDRVGGNTSCVTVEFDDEYVILDAGTGIIDVGDEVLKRDIKKASLLISHAHADHISGFAFFKPLYQRGFDLKVIAGDMIADHGDGKGIESILTKVISPPYFPVPMHLLPSKKTFIDVPAGGEFALSHAKVSTIPLDHPGGSSGYRLDIGDKSICYITDTAHTPGQLNHDLVEFIHRTDLLIYDATFTEEEFAARPNWGHSTWNQAVALAKAAAIKDLALFHHDPNHDDGFMADIEREACSHFSRTFVACEGMVREI